MQGSRTKLALVIPVYGNEGSLEELYRRIICATDKLDVDIVIQFVNDRSPDKSQTIIESLCRKDRRVRSLLLSRNHGAFVAISAGLSRVAKADAVVIMAADLQDPPEIIPEMFQQWQQGKRVVLALRRRRSDPWMSRFFSRVYNKLYRHLIMPDMPRGGLDLCLIDRLVVDVVLKSAEKRTSLVGLILWAGFERGYLAYDRAERVHGNSMWTFRKKMSYFLDSVIAFSPLPMQVFVYLGLLVGFACFVGIVLVIVRYFQGAITIPGYATLVILQLLTAALMFIGFGILGEYSWNNLEQTRKRPLFIVDREIGDDAFTQSPPVDSSKTMVPFFDARRVSAPVAGDLDAAYGRVMSSNRLILGDEVMSFEREMAAELGVPYVVGVASGTDAITLSLWALGVSDGSMVAVPAMSAPATAVAVLCAGCVPVYIDVDPGTATMDVSLLKNALQRYPIRAIVPVHLYGNPCEMSIIESLATQYGVPVIEDCAQSFGSKYDGRPCGTIGICGAFSFYPTKNLGAYGDGGAVVTRSEEICRAIREARFYGTNSAGICVRRGNNSRLDELQAAFLRARLRMVRAHNTERCRLAVNYDRSLSGLNPIASAAGRIPHLYIIRSQARDELARYLSEKGIQTGIHYPVSLPNHPYIASRSQLVDCPQAETLSNIVLSLPLFPGLGENEQQRVIDACLEWLARV